MVEGLDVGGRTISAVARSGRQSDPNVAPVLRTLHAIASEALPVGSGEPLSAAS